tara:strand:+ start:76 stop:357 length:282 start_codon:yes stop_codon:yes gene_type:complete
MNDYQILLSAFQTSFMLSNNLTLIKLSTASDSIIQDAMKSAISHNKKLMGNLQFIKRRMLNINKKYDADRKKMKAIDTEILKLTSELKHGKKS